MKFLYKLGFTLVLFCLSVSFVSAYYNPGKPTNYVNDFSNTLSTTTISALNSELKALQDETSHQIFVAVIPSMKNDYIENFAVKLFEDWKPGQKGKDNGVLFLISMEEKKMKIEVGYGLEGVLTDAESIKIINNIAKPYFQKGDFDTGISESVKTIEKIIRGEIVDLGSKNSNSTNDGGGDTWTVLVFWAVMLVIGGGSALVKFFATTRSWWLGGIIGALVGGAISLMTFAIFGSYVIIIIVILTVGGFLLDYLASTGKIKPPKGGGGHGGGFFWGGGGSGGFGGGGFGGGGGGSSGGGGASGGW
ncbi:MAG: TPM domain-containing protein [Candidatus Gracilibacteria bacterium]